MKGVIFDLDGVIVFTDRFHYLAWKTISDQYDIFFDETINNRLRGVSRMQSLEIILERYQGTPLSDLGKQSMADQKNQVYRTYLETMNPTDVSDEVRTTLKELRNRGYRLALGSSSKNAKYILERVQLTDAFDAISDGNCIKKSKPDPEVFQKAAQYLHLLPEECLVVEDAAAGIDAAIAGGMHNAAIGDAVQYEKAENKLNRFSDLLSLLP